MLAFRDLALRRGGRLLLTGVTATLGADWRVGVVGRNGCGKSTLLAAIGGNLEPDAGSITGADGLRVAALAQEVAATDEPALDFVLGGDVEVAAALALAARADAAADGAAAIRAHQRLDALHGYAAPAKAARLLYGLGFAPDTHTQPVCEFSGGWRVRLGLARALMAPAELLLLDEPTNHLDLDAVIWLERYLTHFQGLLLVVSHDRTFLDAVTTHTLHLVDGGARLYTGNYSAFERQRSEHLQHQQAAHDREQAEREHLEAFVRRFRSKATKARQAQARIKRLQKLSVTAAVRSERTLHFAFASPDRVPTAMLRLEDASAGYASDRPVLNGVGIGIEAGDRVGLLGVNGAGKSTLVKTLAGVLPLLAGERRAHRDLNVGYFAQHTVERLRADSSPIDHLVEMAPGVAPQVLRDYLGRWQFAGERALAQVHEFSGGEKARLALALLAWTKPNLLILDEPTNHLDMDMREALADALNDYAGALVLVSHDRHLLGLTCERFWHVADGRVTAFDGDLDDYAAWVSNQRDGEGKGDPVAATAPPPKVDAAQRRRDAAQARARTQPLRKRLRHVEARLETLQLRLAELTTQLADSTIYASAASTWTDLQREHGQLTEEQSRLEDEWLSISGQLEATGT